MTTYVTLLMHETDEPATASVLGTESQGRWVDLKVGTVSIGLPGRDAAGAAYARHMASVLTAAADQIEQELEIQEKSA